jgi:hemerythrin superfamily protein
VNAVELLKQDHQKVKGLFRDYEAAGENAYKTKQGIVEKVIHELEVHSKIEEEIFYPAFKVKADEEGKDLVAESLQEHHVVKMLMQEMQPLEPDNPEYEAKFTVLMENVEHHADEEEKEMFPKARKVLAAELDQLGTRMEERKRALMASTR